MIWNDDHSQPKLSQLAFPEGALGSSKKAAVAGRGKDDIERQPKKYLPCQTPKAKTVLINASSKTRLCSR